jgi:hypothetical protein
LNLNRIEYRRQWALTWYLDVHWCTYTGEHICCSLPRSDSKLFSSVELTLFVGWRSW